MNKVAINLKTLGKDHVEALKATAKAIRQGYGAGTLVKVDAEQFHTDDDWVGFFTLKPNTWDEGDIDILIEADEDLGNYEMALLVESKIRNFQ